MPIERDPNLNCAGCGYRRVLRAGCTRQSASQPEGHCSSRGGRCWRQPRRHESIRSRFSAMIVKLSASGRWRKGGLRW
jgi:hypothetical protein